MSNLGGISHSVNPDVLTSDAVVKGDPGVVQSVVGGTSVTVDVTDPANPIVNGAAPGETNTASNLGSGGKNVFKQKAGVNLEMRQLKAGTNITLVENTNDITIDASGGGSAASWRGVVPGDGFNMSGDVAGSTTTTTDATFTGDSLKLDYIYFAATTTNINLLTVVSATASGGGTLTVGLHPVIKRGNLGTQDFTADITVGTGSNTRHDKVVAWAIPKGWYALVGWSPSDITNLVHASAPTSAGLLGIYQSLEHKFFNSAEFEDEGLVAFLFRNNYDVSADLTGVDLNNNANYVTGGATVNGEIGFSDRIPIIGLQVLSTA